MGDPIQNTKIIKAISQVSGLSEIDMMRGKKESAVFARLCLIQYYKECGYKHGEIAKMLNKTRSTVIYHLNNFESFYNYVPDFRNMYDRFKSALP